MEISFAPYRLQFKFEARTSRETLRVKDTWFVRVFDSSSGVCGIGEAAYFDALSKESKSEFLAELHRVCEQSDIASNVSSVRFALETALRSMNPISGANAFERSQEGIPINGLIWMGDKFEMLERIKSKLNDGFRVLKLKIGGIDFNEEMDLLRYIRQRFSPEDLELRLDANGGFSPEDALEKLDLLSRFHIHSIEQPICAGRWMDMEKLCRQSAIAIALDEELIGVRSAREKEELLDAIKPHYIILKPTLCGGLSDAEEWKCLAESRQIGWWATSALESNIGLQALSLWVARQFMSVGNILPQGLGTGQLYTNNIKSGLELRSNRLFFNSKEQITLPELQWQK